ncbi:MAG: chlororespiratory reduction protein 7 [Synechococcales bacterium]|nr:chlororespiratory reduction protein 7 [Cyanobacteria bacterium REEB444]MEB3124114.1 chlororespiratory reduction protein 7 [Synechococcales bacterium]
MPHPLMYNEDHFLVLQSGESEQILTLPELWAKLRGVLTAANLTQIPQDLQRFKTVEEQVQYLINTSCELNIVPGDFLQWYAVRLEK